MSETDVILAKLEGVKNAIGEKIDGIVKNNDDQHSAIMIRIDSFREDLKEMYGRMNHIEAKQKTMAEKTDFVDLNGKHNNLKTEVRIYAAIGFTTISALWATFLTLIKVGFRKLFSGSV